MLEPFHRKLLGTNEAFHSNRATSGATNENKTITRMRTRGEKIDVPEILQGPQIATNLLYCAHVKQSIERKRRAATVMPESKATSKPSTQGFAAAVVRFAFD